MSKENSTGELKSRIRRGLLANGASQIIGLFVQIASVPLFFRYWGRGVYGEWLLLSSYPAYLLLADLGFTRAASNEILAKVGADDKPEACRYYATSWGWISTVSTLVFLLFVALVWILPATFFGAGKGTDPLIAREILLLLGIPIISTLQIGIFQIAIRSAGIYAKSAIWMGYFRLIGIIVTAAVLVMGGKMFALALALAVVAIVQTVFFFAMGLRYAGYMCRVKPSFHWDLNRRLLLPSLGFNGFPLANAINLNTTLQVIGALLGNEAVTTFNTTRTLARLVNQATDAISAVFSPEVSIAHGRSEPDLMFRIHRRACRLTMWVGVILCGILAIVGPSVYRLWTLKSSNLSYPLFVIMLVSLVFNAVHTCSSLIQSATNRHKALAVAYVVVAVFALGVAYALIPVIGIYGAGVSMIVFEVTLAIYIIQRTCRLVGDHVGPFLKYILTPPSMGDINNLVGSKFARR